MVAAGCCHRLMMMRSFRVRVGFVVVSVVVLSFCIIIFFRVFVSAVHRMQCRLLVEDGRARVL